MPATSFCNKLFTPIFVDWRSSTSSLLQVEIGSTASSVTAADWARERSRSCSPSSAATWIIKMWWVEVEVWTPPWPPACQLRWGGWWGRWGGRGGGGLTRFSQSLFCCRRPTEISILGEGKFMIWFCALWWVENIPPLHFGSKDSRAGWRTRGIEEVERSRKERVDKGNKDTACLT